MQRCGTDITCRRTEASHRKGSGTFGFDLNGAVMASGCILPICRIVPDSAGSRHNAVIQPGGSIRDNESIEY